LMVFTTKVPVVDEEGIVIVVGAIDQSPAGADPPFGEIVIVTGTFVGYAKVTV
jgi:hypothetical protein